MKKSFILAITAIFIIACGNPVQVPLEFETFEKTVTEVGPEGGQAGLELKVDIPLGEGKLQDNVSAGIKEIMKLSEVGPELKQPIEGKLDELAKRLTDYFPLGVQKGEIESSGAISYQLIIENVYQNSQAVFFHVTDGIFSNGGPSESYKIVRLSDGHVMVDDEILKFTADDIVKLVKTHGSDDQKDKDEAFIGGIGYLCPTKDGCKLLYLYGAHLWETIDVPSSEAVNYLTDEGKAIFDLAETDYTVSINSQDNTEKNVKDTQEAVPGRGELGIFDLRGPVKSCKWKNSNGTSIYTFDKNGFWLTENGKKLNQVFSGGVARDKAGRITSGSFDEFYGVSYSYNALGLITEKFCDGVTNTFTYDNDGYVIKEHIDVAPVMGDEEGESAEQYTLNYTIIEKDAIGNWIKRKSSQGIETRAIEYYP